MKIFIFALKCWLLSVLTGIIMYQIYFLFPGTGPDAFGEGLAFIFFSFTSLITIFVASFITFILTKTVKKFKVTLSTICFVGWLISLYASSSSFGPINLNNLLGLLDKNTLLIIGPIVGLLIGIWIFKLELKNSDVAMENEDILDADM